MKKLDSKIILTTIWHPQKNGQTKRFDGVLLMYLRHYVASDYNNWIKWLPIAKFSYNTIQSISLGNTTFQVAHGFNVLRSINWIEIWQSHETTSSFYSINKAR